MFIRRVTRSNFILRIRKIKLRRELSRGNLAFYDSGKLTSEISDYGTVYADDYSRNARKRSPSIQIDVNLAAHYRHTTKHFSLETACDTNSFLISSSRIGIFPE